MKKRMIALTFIFLIMFPFTAFAKVYEVNPFYALSSYNEYDKIKGLLGESNNIYYGWSRIARDSSGDMVFTDKYDKISIYDVNDYRTPPPLDGGRLTNEINKSLHPESQNLLMVFMSRIKYGDGRDNIIDFLNMSVDDWAKNIIDPMVNTMMGHGFDGVVLDIEGIRDSIINPNYSQDQTSGLKKKYDSFLGILKDRLQGKKLVVCVNMPSYDGYDYPYIYDTADQCLMLAYPYQHYTTYSESDGVPGLVDKIKEIDVPEAEPYEKIKADVEKITSILKQQYGTSYNSEKLLLGTTIEITGWIEKEYTYNSKTYTYFEKTDTLKSGSKFRILSLEAVENLDAPEVYVSFSPVYKYESRTYKKAVSDGLEDGIKKIEYYYDTPETIYEKYYKLVSDYGLGGISVWRLGIGDFSSDESIWSSLNNLFSIYKGDYNESPYIDDVALDKSWTIRFSAPINEDTIKTAKDSIAIVDVYGNLVHVDYSYDKGSNSVKVSPSASYKPGEMYYLIIGKNIKSTGGLILSKPVLMRFKTRSI